MKIFNLFKPNIEKLKTGKKVTPLIKALKYNKDWNVRKSAAEALTAIGWEPINGDGIYYLIALNDWNKLIHIGEPAVEPLIQVLKDENSFTFLEKLRDDELPSNSDVILIMSQFDRALDIFKDNHYNRNFEKWYK